MADRKQVTFSHKELAEALVLRQGIKEGLWGIYIEFGMQAANIATSEDGREMLPVAIIPVLKIGIQEFETENPLTVDAAKLHKRASKTAKSSRRR